jgi:hypothetical protein
MCNFCWWWLGWWQQIFEGIYWMDFEFGERREDFYDRCFNQIITVN